jgi:outer membrane protein assembly factor BamA
MSTLQRLIALLVLLLLAAQPVFAQDAAPKVVKPGKRYIRSITIKINDIFEDYSSTPYKIAESIKYKTHESVIRNELLFKEGDRFDPYLLKQFERNLRLMRYLREIRVVPTFDGDAVDIAVYARDSWTLIPFLSYSSGTGQRNRGVGLTDSNLGGGATRVDWRYIEQASRTSYGFAVSDRQAFGTLHNMDLGIAERSDGTVYELIYGLPFRSLEQRDAWQIDAGKQDTVGRLWYAGTENYIFRQHLDDFTALYTFAGKGAHPAEQDDPYTGIYKGQTILSQRYSVGIGYDNANFYQATEQDYKDLDLDPSTVSNNPADLPADRRFNGPLFQYQSVQPKFITMNYIDRFDRPEDYNLGDESLVLMQVAPTSLGSLYNAVLTTANRSRGWKTTDRSFLRGEIGGSTRIAQDQIENTLLRGEAKYYSVIGDLFMGERFLGRHTLASQFYLDWGERLDKDRQLLLGADTGLRGYEINTFSGDKRFVLNLEERTHLADDVFQLVSLGTAAFIDVGAANSNSIAELFSEDVYSDVGFGLRFCFPRSSGGGVVRIDVAVPLRDGPDGSKAGEPRIIFAAGQLFNARLRSEIIGAENAAANIGFDR